jgi:hypothetical protein
MVEQDIVDARMTLRRHSKSRNIAFEFSPFLGVSRRTGRLHVMIYERPDMVSFDIALKFRSKSRRALATVGEHQQLAAIRGAQAIVRFTVLHRNRR